MHKIRFDGADSEHIYFAAQSRSRKGLWHDLWIVKTGPEAGSIRCACEHCQFRRLRSHVFEPGGGCQHTDWLDDLIDRIFCGEYDGQQAA